VSTSRRYQDAHMLLVETFNTFPPPRFTSDWTLAYINYGQVPARIVQEPTSALWA
jgi:hypothetical protein